jgi:putative DNA primase/helicase
VIDQSAIEDKFNTWVSGKLFLIADEVIARHDLFQLKNKLKAIITGDTIRINPKNLPDYFEKNQFNMVYLSNEIQPVVLEQDDRRHSVFWIKGKQDDDFYKSVAAEIKNGGVSAFYHYLLHLDCGDFNEHTKPVDTDDKKELIDLNRNPIQRFFFHGWVANWTMFKCNLPFQRMFMNSIARGV